MEFILELVNVKGCATDCCAIQAGCVQRQRNTPFSNASPRWCVALRFTRPARPLEGSIENTLLIVTGVLMLETFGDPTYHRLNMMGGLRLTVVEK